MFLQGSIYSSDRKDLLFRFTRRATRTGSTVHVERDYLYPDGRLAVREQVSYEGDRLVSVSLEDSQTGASGSAKLNATSKAPSQSSILFEFRKDGQANPKSGREDLVPDTISVDMVAPFLVDHWKTLMDGQKVKCRYVVIPRRETVGFTFQKTSETSRDGKQVVIIRMEPTSIIIGALVDPLFFTLEKSEPHHILEYSGRTTPKLRDGKGWKDLDAITVFDWGQAGSAHPTANTR